MLSSAAAAVAQPISSTGGLSCGSATATTLAVSWDAVADTDLYYVALATHKGGVPCALQTTSTPNTTLIDLVPSQAYHLTVRSHPSSDNIVWGWRPPAAEVVCMTAAVRRHAPHSLRRQGDAPSERSIALTWSPAAVPPPGGAHQVEAPTAALHHHHHVGVRRLGGGGGTMGGAPMGGAWRWEPAASVAAPAASVAAAAARRQLEQQQQQQIQPQQEHAHELIGLAPGATYEVVVRDEATGEVSDPLRMRTSSVGAVHVSAYRISEYTMDVDFLENHDAASLGAIPVYVQNGGAMNETQIERDDGVSIDGCLGALRAHGCAGGTSFECMACADAHRASVVAQCGNYSDGDHRAHGWAVHFYCGIGWPGSSFQRSPVTEYCVEHAPAPQTDPVPGGDGFAQYVSCNSDECDGALLPTGNVPRDPTCICWVWDDRMLSQEPASHTLAACDPAVTLPWVDSVQCNCSKGPGVEASWLPPDAPMTNYVGRSKVYLPYDRYKQPMEHYPVSVLVGDNLSFPKRKACTEAQALGDDGCTWKRLPQSRMLYGADLVAQGWNATEVRSRRSVS